MLQLRLQPRREGLAEQVFSLTFGEDPKKRIDAGFDWALAQQVGAEAVNRADVCLFEALDGVIQTRG